MEQHGGEGLRAQPFPEAKHLQDQRQGPAGPRVCSPVRGVPGGLQAVRRARRCGGGVGGAQAPSSCKVRALSRSENLQPECGLEKKTGTWRHCSGTALRCREPQPLGRKVTSLRLFEFFPDGVFEPVGAALLPERVPPGLPREQ